jgi:two-component system, NtrC family, response regulator HupR/HoxA
LTFRPHYEVLLARGGEEGLKLLDSKAVALVIVDQRMPGMSGIQFLSRVKEAYPRIMRIIFTGYTDIKEVIDAINRGWVYRYVSKPWDNQELLLIVKQALEYYEVSQELEARMGELVSLNRELQAAKDCLQEENLALRREVDRQTPVRGIVGNSSELRKVLQMVEQVAPTNAPVLIQGESGTGKELIARALHTSGPRSSRPLVILNCAAIPETLLESELFGYERGSFTGAYKRRVGKFEAAHSGTLFLDEIGDISLILQGKLLRTLQDGEIQRIGSNEHHRVDVRIVAATHRNLLQLVKEGRFREDLYYRLNVINLLLPPLRERVEDIPFLIDHFIQKFSQENNKTIRGVEGPALHHLLYYRYPGNIRELENLIHRAVILTRGEWITIHDLPQNVRETIEIDLPVSVPNTNEQLKKAKVAARQQAADQVEKLFLTRLLARTRGKVSAAAVEAGINRSLLQQMISRHGIDLKTYRL